MGCFQGSWGSVSSRMARLHGSGSHCHEGGRLYTHRSLDTGGTSHRKGHIGGHQGWSGGREGERGKWARAFTGVSGEETAESGAQGLVDSGA